MNSVKLQNQYTKINFTSKHTHKKTIRKRTKTIQLTTASKRTKYQGIHLTKELKDLHTEHFQTLMKKMKKT